MEDLIINTIDGDNALIERKFQFHANDTDYILDPKKDITPYELWNVFKFIEDIKLNAHCSNYGNILHNQIKKLKIDRHFKKNILKSSSKTYVSELDKYVGDSYEGGYLAGVIDSTQTEGSSGERYALIVAPKASGEHSGLTWGGYNYTVSGADSTWNGKQNTIDLIADSQSHPAAEFCDSLTISGYSDWYLPAPDELELLYRNFKPTTQGNYTSSTPLHNQTNGYNPNSDPTKDGYTISNPSQTRLSDWQDGGIEFLDDNAYHCSSMEYSSAYAWLQDFNYGSQIAYSKSLSYRVRAVRKVII